MSDRATYSVAFLASTILLQRLAIPLGAQQISVTIPVGLAILALGIHAGEFRWRPAKVRLVALVFLAAVVATLLQLVTGIAPSLLSLALLLALYGMAGLSADLGDGAVARVERAFVGIMSVAAVVSVGQLALQYAGVPHEDYLARVVPGAFLLQGYNTGDPITYGESLIRSNAVLFLEPSFLSLFLGLAVALSVHRGASWALVGILLVGMIPTLAGSGFVVLLPALVLLAATRRRLRLLAIIPAVAAAAVVAVVTPLGELYLERSTEASNPNTSSSNRLVQPYSELIPPSLDDATSAAIGHGAGTADGFLISQGLFDVTAPVLPKVLYEYGLLGIAGIVLPLLLLLLSGVRARPWAAGLLIAYFYVNASLLQSTLVFATLFWISLQPARTATATLRPDRARWHRRAPESTQREPVPASGRPIG